MRKKRIVVFICQLIIFHYAVFVLPVLYNPLLILFREALLFIFLPLFVYQPLPFSAERCYLPLIDSIDLTNEQLNKDSALALIVYGVGYLLQLTESKTYKKNRKMIGT